MRVVFLVPRRNDNGHRDELWRHARARWQAILPDWPIYEGHDTDGLFNRSAAINTASRLADADGRWDVGIVIDSDVMLRRSQVKAAVERASQGYVTWAHRRWREFNEYWTKRHLKDQQLFGPEFEGIDLDIFVHVTNPISWSCCVAIPRATFDEMDGFDERFEGWGFEDGAWAAHVRGLYKWDRIEGDVINLWHPRSPERIILGQSSATASREYIRNALLGRRYMVAAIRDHRVGDQPGEEKLSPEMVEVHVRNLKHDDGKFRVLAKAKGMSEADWSEWWPTLEELRDGAHGYREQVHRSITVVVTSGGKAENWAERSAYLRTSLASLSEKLTGTIAQRVVYSDWPADLRPELEAIANEYGFYIVGEGNHGHTGMRKRLWAYLAKHAQGEFVFATEDDFLYTQPIDLDAMVRTLRDNAHLAQVALLRGAYYQDEKETGGILGWPEPAFTAVGQNGTSRLEHRQFWTNNPSVFRKSLTKVPWPNTQEDPRTGRGKGSEVVFADVLKRDPSVRFAFWGSGEAAVEHIGAVRAGTGY